MNDVYDDSIFEIYPALTAEISRYISPYSRTSDTTRCPSNERASEENYLSNYHFVSIF